MSDVDLASPPLHDGEVLPQEHGVDLTLIRQLRAMTPTERAEALRIAANNLIVVRNHVRRI